MESAGWLILSMFHRMSLASVGFCSADFVSAGFDFICGLSEFALFPRFLLSILIFCGSRSCFRCFRRIFLCRLLFYLRPIVFLCFRRIPLSAFDFICVSSDFPCRFRVSNQQVGSGGSRFTCQIHDFFDDFRIYTTTY